MSPVEKRVGVEALAKTPETSASEAVRVVLDREASLSFDRMAQALRAEGSVRLSPSKLVSFVVQLFFSNHFDKDKEILLGECFDSKAFIESELKKADPSEVGAVLERAMLKVRRMQELKKRGMKSAKTRGNGDGHG